MAEAIKISLDRAKLSADLRKLTATHPRQAAAGLNRAAQRLFTLSVREIQKNTGASAQLTIRRNLTVLRATEDKAVSGVNAYSAKKNRIPIFELRPKPRSVTKRRPVAGVSYGDGRLIPGSFVAQFKSGHTGVFKRIGVKVRELNYQLAVRGTGAVARVPQFTSSRLRERIIELFGPSVALVFSRKQIHAQLRELAAVAGPEELQRAFKFAR